jgi:hypothetical protein
MNYGLKKVIGMNETGFDGTMDAIYRIQGWDFLLAGGALYNNLDYSFTTEHEEGTFQVPGSDPGWGSPALRRQLGNLREFMTSLPFVRMHPDAATLKGGVPENGTARLLVDPGNVYAMYLHHGKVLSGFQPQYVVEARRQQANLEFELPSGEYAAEWFHPRGGPVQPAVNFSHPGGVHTLATPEYSQDLALIIRARR